MATIEQTVARRIAKIEGTRTRDIVLKDQVAPKRSGYSDFTTDRDGIEWRWGAYVSQLRRQCGIALQGRVAIAAAKVAATRPLGTPGRKRPSIHTEDLLEALGLDPVEHGQAIRAKVAGSMYRDTRARKVAANKAKVAARKGAAKK